MNVIGIKSVENLMHRVIVIKSIIIYLKIYQMINEPLFFLPVTKQNSHQVTSVDSCLHRYQCILEFGLAQGIGNYSVSQVRSNVTYIYIF